MIDRRTFGKGLGAAALATVAGLSDAREVFPNGPIKVVVPFAPGGAVDLLARLFNAWMQEGLNTPVVTENKAGASGMLGTEFVAKSKPNGQTLLFGTAGTHAVNPVVFPTLRYKPLEDFIPLAIMGDLPIAVYANPELPRSLADIIQVIRRNPDKYKYGTVQYGTAHLAMERVKAVGGLQMQHIPYRGAVQAMQETAAGLVHLTTGSIESGQSFTSGGKLNLVGVLTETRLPHAPDTPTFEEVGLKGCAASTWNAYFAPKGTPAGVSKKLQDVLNAALADRKTQEQALAHGMVPMGQWTTQQQTAFITRETEKWRRNFEYISRGTRT